MENKKLGSVALIGGGPAALFMLKEIVNQNLQVENIYIFEKNERLGVGMPYGKYGSCNEHLANVSANEIPELIYDVADYLSRNPTDDFPDYYINGKLNPYQVLPRLLLGNYLENQFHEYIKLALKLKIKVHVLTDTAVTDLLYDRKKENYKITITDDQVYDAEVVVICTGHYWPLTFEGKKKGWYDSPYPPSKFDQRTNFPVAIKGASLTAVDAVKTLSRLNGQYFYDDDKVSYVLNEDSKNFSIHLFSTGGYLPALRFHSESEPYSLSWSMTLDEIYDYKEKNNGFVALDYVFERNFKNPIRHSDPEFYEKIKDMTIEEFVEEMLSLRKELDSFTLFRAEYLEAKKSINRRKSISWKERLAAFSYAMNYPAKHFSAEDMLRLRKVLMPLISVIIASLPQESYKEIIALYEAGVIEHIQVDRDSHVDPHADTGAIYRYVDIQDKKHEHHYQLYVDGTGQQPLEFNDLPFEGLKDQGLISTGYLNFKDPNEGKKYVSEKSLHVKSDSNNSYYMQVKGLSINDYFQALDAFGNATKNLFIMAVPFIGGLNPDYSGLDFCDTASRRIVKFINQ
ncbi:FAD/NAD(P)-binding protein [Sphingobacterium sp. UBA6320]|uniref:FAD/NAD(P)-binding protein n=1 Tax=Sphingobacterium sp. UBA6320 TaxID=1947510 RepID=UPI0025F254FA|nr:FAD/NAD(P)-binding protein [Sphingobacterium sp. UBA6320]